MASSKFNSANFCDFHTHLHQYDVNDSCLDQINNNKILTIACSMDMASYEKTVEMKNHLGSNLIIPTFGIHPACAMGDFNKDVAFKYMEESPIIGEIGLDFLWAKNVPKDRQLEVFKFFLEYCNKTGKYCVIHTKGAEKEILEILKYYPNACPIIHWYHGPEKYFKEIIRRGYYCTFGVELFHSKYIRKLFKQMPLDKILAETDNPESEVWLGGSRRDPMLIEDVVKAMANVKGINFSEMNEIVLNNSKKILQEAGLR